MRISYKIKHRHIRYFLIGAILFTPFFLNGYELYTIDTPIEEERPLTIEEKIEATFPEKAELFISIAKAESGLDPKAYNPEAHRGCNGSYGILQIACLHYEARGIYGKDRFSVAINLEVAREVYEERGVRAWGVCHSYKGEAPKVDCW